MVFAALLLSLLCFLLGLYVIARGKPSRLDGALLVGVAVGAPTAMNLLHTNLPLGQLDSYTSTALSGTVMHVATPSSKRPSTQGPRSPVLVPEGHSRHK
jgi:hypothetical protein